MKIQIEDYYGNDIITLRYYGVRVTSLGLMNIGEIAENARYNIADDYEDEEDNHIVRVQEYDINDDNESKKLLLKLINGLNEYFL